MTMATMATVAATRWRPTPDQLMILEELYVGGIKTPSAGEIQRITAHLSLYGKIECKNVFYWFQNHKAREKQKIRKRLLLGKQLMCHPLQQQQQQQQPSSPPPPLILPAHNHLQYPPPHPILGPQYNVLYLVEEPAAHPHYNRGLLQNSHQGSVAPLGSPPAQMGDSTWIRLSCTHDKSDDDDALMTPAAPPTTTPPPTSDPTDDSSSATSITSAASAPTTTAIKALETLPLFPTTSPTAPRYHPVPASKLSLSLSLSLNPTIAAAS